MHNVTPIGLGNLDRDQELFIMFQRVWQRYQFSVIAEVFRDDHGDSSIGIRLCNGILGMADNLRHGKSLGGGSSVLRSPLGFSYADDTFP